MQNQSRVEIWYSMGTNKVLLGEVQHSDQVDLLALWRSVSMLNTLTTGDRREPGKENTGSYRIKLLDDGGQQIGSKEVSEDDAEKILVHDHWMVHQSRNRFSRADALYTWVPVVAG
ncbi:hypothetical protein [Vibrio rarus]|uniref:hypothetical protein n=1 Tax=Vibrio rarus TaxID=413403 RepID=UPI0021C45B37|nr:hypothetical protein [Vibrio rarus]